MTTPLVTELEKLVGDSLASSIDCFPSTLSATSNPRAPHLFSPINNAHSLTPPVTRFVFQVRRLVLTSDDMYPKLLTLVQNFDMVRYELPFQLRGWEHFC